MAIAEPDGKFAPVTVTDVPAGPEPGLRNIVGPVVP